MTIGHKSVIYWNEVYKKSVKWKRTPINRARINRRSVYESRSTNSSAGSGILLQSNWIYVVPNLSRFRRSHPPKKSHHLRHLHPHRRLHHRKRTSGYRVKTGFLQFRPRSSPTHRLDIRTKYGSVVRPYWSPIIVTTAIRAVAAVHSVGIKANNLSRRIPSTVVCGRRRVRLTTVVGVAALARKQKRNQRPLKRI